jgi:hypothetical protein
MFFKGDGSHRCSVWRFGCAARDILSKFSVGSSTNGLGCGVRFRQLGTYHRARPGQLYATSRHGILNILPVFPVMHSRLRAITQAVIAFVIERVL